MDQTTEHRITSASKLKSAVKIFISPPGDAAASPASIPPLHAEIVSAFARIEALEVQIKHDREDIAGVIETLVNKGLHRKAIRLALDRRKFASDGDLEDVDASLRIICGVESLGLQGELFEALIP